ncbi:MAG TPA: branched-chain amino acid ABC transporter substrate-binding protein [Acidimicrobiia bacterium]
MKTKRGLKLLTVLAVLSLILAACGGSEGGETTTTAGSEATTTTAATAETTTTAAPDEGLGSVTVAAGEAIQIRSLEAISGDVSTLGIPNQNSTQLAIADYGQIQGHDVTFGTGLDDLCSADGGQAAASQIVADAQVVGVIGTSCSGAAAGAMPLISDAGLVMISPSNTSPSLTSDLAGTAAENYFPGYYRTAHNDLYQGRAAAEFMVEQGITKAAAIHDGDPYTDGLATAFADAFTELGGEVVIYTAVQKGDTDMVPVLTEVAGAAPEAIFFPIFPPEGNFIVQQIAGVSGLEDVLLMAADGLLVDNFMELPESADMYFSGPDQRYGANANGVTGKSADEVLAAYNETFGEAPTAAFWAHAYDATVMLLDAINTVAVDDGSGNLTIDRQALRDQLNSVSGFAGLIGTLSCDDFGDCGATKITVVQNTDPSDIAAGKQNVVFEFVGAS